MSSQTQIPQRVWLRLGISLAILTAIFIKPLASLVRSALSDENTSHTLLIPLIVAWLLYTERHHIFGTPGEDRFSGLILTGTGVAAALWAFYSDKQQHSSDALTFYTLGFVLLCLASCAVLFGRKTMRNGFFPFAFS